MTKNMDWINLYRQALKEPDAEKRVARVEEAEAAMKQVLRRLFSSWWFTQADRSHAPEIANQIRALKWEAKMPTCASKIQTARDVA